MLFGIILIVTGALVAVGVLSFVHQLSMFGNTCYFIGEMNIQSECIQPVFYYAALGAAAVLVLVGIVLMLKPTTGSPTA